MDGAHAIIDRLYELLAAGDVERLAMLYSGDGEIIRYDSIASTRAEIEAYYRDHLARHPGSKLRHIDKVRQAGSAKNTATPWRTCTLESRMAFGVTCPTCGKAFSITDEIYQRKVSGRVVTIKCKQC